MMDETSASMKHARSHNMMVDHGPSYTTGRLLKFGTHVVRPLASRPRSRSRCSPSGTSITSGIHHFHRHGHAQQLRAGQVKYQVYPAHISDVYDFDNVPKLAVTEDKERDVVLA